MVGGYKHSPTGTLLSALVHGAEWGAGGWGWGGGMVKVKLQSNRGAVKELLRVFNEKVQVPDCSR